MFCGFVEATAWLAFFAVWQSSNLGLLPLDGLPQAPTFHICRRALIAPEWILIMAYCVDDTISNYIYIAALPGFSLGREADVLLSFLVDSHNILQSLKSPHFALYQHILYRGILQPWWSMRAVILLVQINTEDRLQL